MSLRFEQYNSLLMTRRFMRDLLDPQKRPKTVKETRARVCQCLRHFPLLRETGEPMFSQDSFPIPQRRDRP